MTKILSPHGDKLTALIQNSKLPKSDIPRVKAAQEKYKEWIKKLKDTNGEKASVLKEYVKAFDEYKRYVDLELIFDSENDFLYRQKGQLKLDNTVIEEFLPLLVLKYFESELNNMDLFLGPTTCISGIRFDSGLATKLPGGGIQLRQKDQDFAISRPLFLKASHKSDFSDAVVKESKIAYIASECKTNLDKTMFQEAAATALDVKTAVPSAKYYLLCEWLDMTPISTSSTAIDEIIILRKAKRLSSNVRSEFNESSKRKEKRTLFKDFLTSNPFTESMFKRFLDHIEVVLKNDDESEVLKNGYF